MLKKSIFCKDYFYFYACREKQILQNVMCLNRELLNIALAEAIIYAEYSLEIKDLNFPSGKKHLTILSIKSFLIVDY